LRFKTPLFYPLFWLHRAREIVKRLSSICKFIPRRGESIPSVADSAEFLSRERARAQGMADKERSREKHRHGYFKPALLFLSFFLLFFLFTQDPIDAMQICSMQMLARLRRAVTEMVARMRPWIVHSVIFPAW